MTHPHLRDSDRREPPLPPTAPDENAVCPKCGDEAFFVETDTPADAPYDFAFTCDSCDYFYDALENPLVTMRIAKYKGYR